MSVPLQTSLWLNVYQPAMTATMPYSGESEQPQLDPGWTGGIALVIFVTMVAGMCWLVFRD